MSTRRILALLVVLALSLGLCSVPAGSATLQRTSSTGDSEMTVTTFKDGDDGEDIDGGDDDRWGNTTIGGDGGTEGADDNEEEDDPVEGEARLLGRVGVLHLGIRTLFGFLVILL